MSELFYLRTLAFEFVLHAQLQVRLRYDIFANIKQHDRTTMFIVYRGERE